MPANTWRLIDTGFSGAYLNMAIDEVLMMSCKNGLSKYPVMRFYQWKPSGLSLGYAQKYGEGFSINNCKALGIDVVRRITGGQTVLHDGDLTYSVAVPEDYLETPKTKNLYEMVSLGLKEGLKKLGIKAHSLNPDEAKNKDKAYNCFCNISSYEILINGKKLVGSAQRRTTGALLQHGAILVKVDYEKLSKIFSQNEDGSGQGVSKIREKITSLEENLESAPDTGKIKEAIVEGFANLFGIKFTCAPLSDEELSSAERLSCEKYSSREWNEIK
ncbi:MAG: hypothetical protein A2042_05125 [Candidatus Schekmanbacteria bacterium GWA2_38_11]|uniref:BPL/LPL catalytic domain-containing protein n=1 Tax=Candidatus Schekmanbacteria bacterium GWA2_38_11 TaxID=1817876 RepID=A0A1F7RP02_9BACT|nr:MAG: hypothetical protein A2042_05125 [Candidatus Schekmanbacteria bacterium GWA2_38_11]